MLRTMHAIYTSTGIAMHHSLSDGLDAAESIMPTGKLYGKLLPYIGESLHKLRDGSDLILNIVHYSITGLAPIRIWTGYACVGVSGSSMAPWMAVAICSVTR